MVFGEHHKPSESVFGQSGPKKKSEGSGEVPDHVAIPDLKLEQGWPPALTGEIPGGASQGPEKTASPGQEPQPAPTVSAYRVLPSSLRHAEAVIMTPLKTAVDEAHDLKKFVETHKNYIFWRPENGSDEDHFGPNQDQLNAVKFLENAVLNAFDALTIAGKLVNRLNMSAQIYVHADKESFFPLD